ncbi:MAG: YdeI/OmpD-associated family protein [Chitinophagaceae bacterium]
MVQFTTTILQFEEKGDKTGWTYIYIPADIAGQVNPGNKKAFRVKGKLDDYAFEGTSILPMGDGGFIFALNATFRKNIRKRKGATINVQLQLDPQVMFTPDWMIECLSDEPAALAFFNQLAKSHQRYFVNWIQSAKTEPTRIKRLSQTITALSRKTGFGEMIRMHQNKKSEGEER